MPKCKQLVLQAEQHQISKRFKLSALVLPQVLLLRQESVPLCPKGLGKWRSGEVASLLQWEGLQMATVTTERTDFLQDTWQMYTWRATPDLEDSSLAEQVRPRQSTARFFLGVLASHLTFHLTCGPVSPTAPELGVIRCRAPRCPAHKIWRPSAGNNMIST